jgi:uncharacterized protein YbjT (DUF2867 family)
MNQKSALLLGAGGLVGGYCLQYLLADDAYSQVTIVVRRPLTLTHPKLDQRLVDFERLNETFKDVPDHDDVFCCLGTTMKKAGSKEAFYKVDYRYPVEFGKLSLANGAKQFLLISALGANPTSSVFYNRVKGEVEQAIEHMGFTGCHIFRPSLLLGQREEKRILEDLGQKAFTWLSAVMVGPLRKYRAIEAKAVACTMVRIARERRQGNHILESQQIQEDYDKHRNQPENPDA